MPIDACQWFYDCSHCGVLLKPKSGDCCVYCSYATVPCPPVQATNGCGSSTAGRDQSNPAGLTDSGNGLVFGPSGAPERPGSEPSRAPATTVRGHFHAVMHQCV